MIKKLNFPYVKKALCSAVFFISVSSSFLASAETALPEKTATEISSTTNTASSTNNAISPTKKRLIDKLNNIAFFQANFSQQVFDNDGQIIQQGSGTLAIKKPNLVHWQTLEPDENLIVSDGDNIWLYDPWVEQVTVYLFERSVANTPILLLTSDDLSLWSGYKVTQINNETFAIHSLDTNSQVKTLTLTFKAVENAVENKQEQLIQITFLDATGQLSKITLHQADYKTALNDVMFTFTLPEGVTVDDQR